MSLRSFVSLCSILLMGWLALAFLHSSPGRMDRGLDEDSAAAVAPPASEKAAEIDDLAVSVSP